MANQKNYGLHVEGLGYDMTRLCLILLEQSSLALFFCSFPWFISKHRKAPPLMFNLSFQLIPVSSSSCRPINNLYGNIWLQPSVRCHHQSYTFIENFSMFRLHVHKLRGFFAYAKKKKKTHELLVGILEIGTTISFKFDIQSTTECRHLHKRFGLVWIKDHGGMNVSKLVHCYPC